MEWTFYKQLPTDPIRNPISGEFFSTEAVGDVADSVIREAIQNTLDARNRKPDGSRERARVRIFLSEASGAISPARAARWFGTLWEHIQAPRNGLRDQPKTIDACPYLVFEDFGTIGLTGDPEEYRVFDNTPNNFLNFFRAEGHSDKGEQDRGSWGVGKTVFPRASRISSYFGFTVREDDHKRLLLGRSILKYHSIFDESFKSDGYCGISQNNGFVHPCGDADVLNEFRSDFCITRDSEPGLSIVVPWYDMDPDDGISRAKVVRAVIWGFFYPILTGHLEVTIATPDSEMRLNEDSIIPQVEAMGGNERKQLLPMLELAFWGKTRVDPEFKLLLAPPTDRAQKLTPDLVTAELIKTTRDLFERRERVALRVPMSVQPRAGNPVPTFFNVFLEHSDLDQEKPLFIRDELIISDVKSQRISQVRALVIVEDKPLATLLRDAETPAHTQWNSTTSNFKHKYKFGAGAIDFVRFAVAELLRIINQSENKPDPSITIDYFSIPAPPEGDDPDAIPARRRESKKKEGKEASPPIPPLPKAPTRFRIDKLRGGFSIKPGAPDSTMPPILDIRVAYDLRRGNPLKKYHPADFDLRQTPIRWDIKDNSVDVRSVSGNRMQLAVQSPGFQVDVTGFDPNRDLYVRATVREGADAD